MYTFNQSVQFLTPCFAFLRKYVNSLLSSLLMYALNNQIQTTRRNVLAAHSRRISCYVTFRRWCQALI